MDPLECLGQTFMGLVKSYNSQKGYGFATCDKLEGDLFFLHRHLPADVVNEAQYGRDLSGEEIAFTCDVTPEGKPQASEIRVLENGTKKKTWKGKGKGKSYGGDYWGTEYYETGKGSWGKSSHKGGDKGGKKGKGERKERPGSNPDVPGESLLNDERVTGTIRTYNHNSRWGFAVTEADIPNAENIFVHMNNLHEEMVDQDIFVREGDIIEMRLEEVEGKPVARDVKLYPQEASLYADQWMTGYVKSFDEKRGYGFISSPRIDGDIWFAKSEMPKSLIPEAVDTKIIFKLTIGPDAKPKGKMINYVGNTDKLECVDRLKQVVDNLEAEGYVDETAAKSLVRTPCDELFAVLPVIEFYTAENPSSFIVGALSRYRKGGYKGGYVGSPGNVTSWSEKKGGGESYTPAKGKDSWGYGKDSWSKGGSWDKGYGKGKSGGKGGKWGRSAPY